MTHLPPDAQSWSKAGANARPTASGEQINDRRGQRAVDGSGQQHAVEGGGLPPGDGAATETPRPEAPRQRAPQAKETPARDGDGGGTQPR